MIRRALSSALLYTLAFNLTFLVQELFLVVPKAFVAGLHPRLYHNNHTWEGSSPLAALLQGTGALATTLSGLICLTLLAWRPWRPWRFGARLFLIWMAFSGFFMALPQVVLGAAIPANDVGMAMAYLGLSSGWRAAAAIAALIALARVAQLLARAFLGCAPDPGRLSSAAARERFILTIVTVPALIAIPLIVPFRVPREAIEVVAVPAVVSVVGALFVQAAALRSGAAGARAAPAEGPAPIVLPLAALIALLLFFQLVLRHGIAFG